MSHRQTSPCEPHVLKASPVRTICFGFFSLTSFPILYLYALCIYLLDFVHGIVMYDTSVCALLYCIVLYDIQSEGDSPRTRFVYAAINP